MSAAPAARVKARSRSSARCACGIVAIGSGALKVDLCALAGVRLSTGSRAPDALRHRSILLELQAYTRLLTAECVPAWRRLYLGRGRGHIEPIAVGRVLTLEAASSISGSALR